MNEIVKEKEEEEEVKKIEREVYCVHISSADKPRPLQASMPQLD